MNFVAIVGKFYPYVAEFLRYLQVCRSNKKVIVGIVVCFVFGGAISRLSVWRKKQHLRRKIAVKRNQREASFQQVRESLPTDKDVLAKQKEIVGLSIENLLQQLKDDILRPVEVLQAYQSAALRAHGNTNCLIEPISEAFTWAKNLDSNPKGLLYGLPIAVKDDFCVKGYESTLGCAQFLGKFAKEDCVIVKVLKSQGAIPFVKTNAAQCLLSLESANPIFGLTVNAHNKTRSAGGSSGGTGALVASGGAPIGTGSDLAGSIRIPAAFNGMCGFKPTPQRISQKGCGSLANSPFPDLVPWSYGPISPTVAGAVVFMKAMWSGRMFEEDPSVSPIPFQENVFASKKPLRIGYFVKTGGVPLAPANDRAVLMAKSALEASGHTVVPYAPPDMKRIVTTLFQAVAGDGGHTLLKILRNDLTDERSFGNAYTMLNLPRWLIGLLDLFIKPLSGKMYYSLKWKLHTCRSVAEWWECSSAKDKLTAAVLDDWKTQKLDGLLCPSYGAYAFPVCSQLPWKVAYYTLMFNVLQCPAGVLPVTTVNKEDVRAGEDIPEHGYINNLLKKGIENSEGLPICVQCAALPYRDEVCLRVMADIERNVTNI